MTNPTSNFGWQMPTPTDLVTDLPADFEVFGQAVDTSMADLKGGTTGQILSKATNTDMDFTWITNDVGDITNVAVTSPITGGGSSGSVTIGVSAASTSASGVVQLSDSTSTTSSVLASTPTATKAAYDLANTANTAAGTAQTTANAAIPKSTVTTNGDVIYATGSAAVTRLGIGSTGQVLTVAAGIPSWATPTAGMTLLGTPTTLSGASTVISGISQDYTDLYVLMINATTSVSSVIRFDPNSTTGNGGFTTFNGSTVGTTGEVSTNGSGTAGRGSVLKISDYTSTDWHPAQIYGVDNATPVSAQGSIRLSAAITSIRVATTAGTFSAGTVKIYGVK